VLVVEEQALKVEHFFASVSGVPNHTPSSATSARPPALQLARHLTDPAQLSGAVGGTLVNVNH